MNCDYPNLSLSLHDESITDNPIFSSTAAELPPHLSQILVRNFHSLFHTWTRLLVRNQFLHTHFSKFGNFFLCHLCSMIFTLHFILFLSHKPIRNARLLREPISKFIATAAAFTFNFFLYFVPEQSLTGLLFVLCLWIDVVAIIQIVRPSSDLKLVHLILMAIVTRAISLYDFTNRTLLVLFFCFLVLYVQYFLEEVNAIQEKRERQQEN